MKSFFEFCDAKDSCIKESAVTQIAKTALGNVGLTDAQIESMSLLFQFVELAVIEKKDKVISHLRQIAGNNEELNTILDQLMSASNNLSAVKTASTKASQKFDIPAAKEENEEEIV